LLSTKAEPYLYHVATDYAPRPARPPADPPKPIVVSLENSAEPVQLEIICGSAHS
jgi:hypothetical protein